MFSHSAKKVLGNQPENNAMLLKVISFYQCMCRNIIKCENISGLTELSELPYDTQISANGSFPFCVCTSLSQCLGKSKPLSLNNFLFSLANRNISTANQSQKKMNESSIGLFNINKCS